MTTNDTKTQNKKNIKKNKRASSEAKKLRDQISQIEKEKEELNDKYLRLNAEFNNYKKRTDKEFLSLVQNANEKLITDLLPIVDDMERSVDHLKKDHDFESLLKGIKLIHKNLMTILEKQGVEPLQSVGEEFDPEKHEALMQVKKDKTKSNIIVDEHLKGYTLNDKVIRHAQVIVSK